jgi:hypothetical protein
MTLSIIADYCYADCRSCRLSLMLSGVMLNVVMLIVVAPVFSLLRHFQPPRASTIKLYTAVIIAALGVIAPSSQTVGSSLRPPLPAKPAG